jgi:hypothetical protein
MTSAKGRWFWFGCQNEKCGWITIRYRNARVCQKCKGPLLKKREANQKVYLANK